MAAAQAVLTVIKEENLQEHSRVVGAQLLAELRTLMDKYACVGDVRGAGLFIGFELVTDRESKTPDKALALNLIEKLREKPRADVGGGAVWQCAETASANGVSGAGY